MILSNTPQSIQLHVGLFGKTNTGKSSLLNAIVNQNMSIVSEISGTTTDVVYKSMELNPIGPIVFIDTAGYNDETPLGKQRIEKTQIAFEKSDIILLILTDSIDFNDELWIKKSLSFGKKIIPVINKIDIISDELILKIEFYLKNKFNLVPIKISSKNDFDIAIIKDELVKTISEGLVDYTEKSFTGSLCKKGDKVLLVMPQDIQAPKGRLILPQVQILRELLDKKCIVNCCTTDMFEQTLYSLKEEPNLIICDSQIFKFVSEKKPENSLLTSFSALLAANKGQVEEFIKATKVLENISSIKNVLIAEACTHSPLEEDIGREKIPRMLKNKNPEIKIDFVSGKDFPQLIDSEGNRKYDLIIHCGACMFNASFMLARQKKAIDSNIPMTNYGIFIAAVLGILDKIVLPK